MPCLKYIIENAKVKELRLLRGKSIECASLIGLAVGSDKVSVTFGKINFNKMLNIIVLCRCISNNESFTANANG